MGEHARYISKYRRYKLTAREHVTMTLANGKDNVIQQGVICEFQHGGVLYHELELAAKYFQFKGITQEEDEATPVDPVFGPTSRVSVFDTGWPHLQKAWAQAEKHENVPPGTIEAEVIEFLDNYTSNGRDYLKVVVEKPVAPWPAYDKLTAQGRRTIEMVVEKIVAAIEDLGVDPQTVLAYERQGLNRAEVISAVEALSAPKLEPEPEDLVAA